MSKKCKKCGVEKPLDDFYNRKRGAIYRRNSACKKCNSKLAKEYRNNNEEKIKKYYKKWYEENKEKRYEYNKNWVNENGEKVRIWREGRREESREYRKKWGKENEERIRNYGRKKLLISKNRLDNSMGSAVYSALKSKKAGRRWEILVGYTTEDLIAHLENQFELWMTWENYGKWHVDHILPRSYFKYETAEDPEFKKCWALENLRPLEAIENIRKSNKLYGQE